MKTIDRLLESQHARQSVLDLLHATPQGMTGPEIGKHFGWLDGTTGSRLKAMADDEELRRDPEFMLVPNGRFMRRQPTWRYFAVAVTTKQAADLMRELGKNLTKEGRAEKEGKPASTEKRNIWIGGNYRNDPNDRASIQNQGGQGRSQPRLSTYLEAAA